LVYRRFYWLRGLRGGGLGGQIPLLMEKFLHFARVFEKKYQTAPPIFFRTKIMKICCSKNSISEQKLEI